jgi:hypothetical protein
MLHLRKLLMILPAASLGVLPAAAQPAEQTPTIRCSAFQDNHDGSWSPKQPITIATPGGGQVNLTPGVSLRPGVSLNGIDLAGLLEQQCHR